MAVHARSRQEVAIKFYVSRTAFQDEAAQYSDAASPLRSLLPRCLGIHDNADSSYATPLTLTPPPPNTLCIDLLLLLSLYPDCV